VNDGRVCGTTAIVVAASALEEKDERGVTAGGGGAVGAAPVAAAAAAAGADVRRMLERSVRALRVLSKLATQGGVKSDASE
jgi:hypothetical protein